MPNYLFSLGSFSFKGLESPDKVTLRSKQRLVVHHLGSGLSVTDSLGDDFQIANFGGFFTGPDAPTRIRLIDGLRTAGMPLALTWDSLTLSVIIQDFELTYLSSQWIKYKLSCRVIQSKYSDSRLSQYVPSASASTQLSDIVGLLQNTGLTATFSQSTALFQLATMNYDTASQTALASTQELFGLINNTISTLDKPTQTGIAEAVNANGDYASWFIGFVKKTGQQASLIGARNRVRDICVRAEAANQQ
jgi:hypothetical protein